MSMRDKDWHYSREKLAKKYMEEFTRYGCRALAIFSERQVGKTEFLTRDLAPEAIRRKHYPVYVDIWSARADPARAIANTLKGHVLALKKSGLPGLRELSFTAGLFSMGAKLDDLDKHRDAHEPEDTVDRLGYWASRLAKATGRRRILLMLDEAQSLAASRNALNEISALRAAFQMNSGKYAPVFTGSSRARLEQLFNDSNAPLFKYGDQVEFPKLDDGFVNYMLSLARKHTNLHLDPRGALAVFDALGRRPGEFIGLVRSMMRAGNSDFAAGLAKKLLSDQERARVALHTQGLSELEHLVLRRVASRGDPFSAEALAWYGRQVQPAAKAPTKSAIQWAVRTLRHRLLIESDSQTGRFRVSDEQLERALRDSESTTAGR
jgi:hypothetical protein